ncbi:MAG: ATP-binding protein [Persicimonas sp.]
MAQTDELGVLDNLVTQFSSPLDCFRELVQNSIDAGSPTVEVWTEYIPGEGHEGTIALHVDDFGEGMDEQIIDDQFTRLFASTKEDDLTKIGKFGIGFVSVFALKPKAILVQTGRGGQYWEVLFHEDRSFTKSKLDVPVEGTQLTLFLAGDVHRYTELVEGIQKSLTRWCNHSETEVTFEDRTPADGGFSEMVVINEPFEVEGGWMVRDEHQGTEIVAAYNHEPVYGFYNRGLTLALTGVGDDVLGRRAGRFRHIGFKIKSRYLEHTLSRETVMRDENYEKAMALLEEAVDTKLFGSLIDRIAELAATVEWTLTEIDRYGEYLSFLRREPIELIEGVDKRPFIRLLDGGLISLDELYETWKRDGRVLVADGPTELSDELQALDVPIVYGRPPTSESFDHPLEPVRKLIHRYLTHRVETTLVGRIRKYFGQNLKTKTSGALVAPELVYMPVVIDEEVADEARELVEAAAGLLEEVDAGYRKLTTCELGAPDQHAPLFVLARRLGPVMARPPRGVAEERPAKRPEAAVNRDHPHFRRLLELHAHSPQIAAYCLAKSLLLTEDRMLDADVDLIAACTEAS